tara:strand:+ start:308 stop:934 length:627 start_codon:yes stop_codon:yes gene_type:complete
MSKEPMKLTPQQRKMLANLPAGTAKNRFRVDKPGQTTPSAETTDVTTAKKRLQRLLDAQKKYSNYKKYNTPSPGDVDPETGDVIPEGVQKAGHPEAFELGLDKETTSNAEYQKILRRKRIERAAQMSDPNHPTHTDDSSDTTLDDVEAADRAARRRRRIGEAMEKQGMLFKTEPEQKTTTVVPAVVGKDRKRATDQRSRENVKRSKKR